MNRKKILLMVLLTLILLLSVVCGVFWHMRHYVLIDMQFYPRDVQQLDLRDREISIRLHPGVSTVMTLRVKPLEK